MKKISLIALICVIVLAFAACAAPAVEEPVVEEPVAEEEPAVEEPVEEEPAEEEPVVEEEPAAPSVTAGGIVLTYDPEVWRDDSAAVGGAVPYLVLLATDMMDTKDTVQAYVYTDANQAPVAAPEVLDAAFVEAMGAEKAAVPNALGGEVVVNTAEVQTLENGTQVAVFDTQVLMTEAYLDFCVENGYMTEDQITTWGGRAALVGAAASSNWEVYVPKDGMMIYFCGVYQGTGTKPIVLEEILKMAQTVEWAPAA